MTSNNTVKLLTSLLVLSMFSAGAIAKDTIKLKAYVPTNPTAVPTKALEYFADNVGKATDGKVDITVFHSGQLGNDREGIESTRIGLIDIMFAGTGGYSTFYDKSKILDLPFLFDDAQQAYQKVNGPVGEALFSDMGKYGLHYLSTGDNGMRHISTSGREINSLNDIKGLKVRVPGINTYVDLWTEWGAVVTPTPVTELYMALKTGIVEAQDNAPYHSVASKVYEVQDHYSMINYMWMGLTMTMNDVKWNKLPEDVQLVIKDEAVKAAKWSFEQIEKDNVEALKLMESRGIAVNYNPDRDSFKANIDDFYSRYENEDWYDVDIIKALTN